MVVKDVSIIIISIIIDHKSQEEFGDFAIFTNVLEE